MKSLTRPELDALLAVAKKESPDFDYPMFLVTFNHGLRNTETRSLDKTYIVDGYLVIQRLKGSEKTIQPLLDDERAILNRLAATHDGRFFPISRWTFWRRMQEYGEKAGIPEFKRHVHVLKHTTGRLGYLGGMGIPEIQTYLGHVNGGNAMIYMQATEDEASKAFAAAVGK